MIAPYSAPKSSARSIRSYMLRAQISVAVIILVASGLAYVMNNFITVKQDLINSAISTAKILGRNLEPTMAFLDFDESKKILATLGAEPTIEGASLFDTKSNLVATFGEPPQEDIKNRPWPNQLLLSESDSSFVLFYPILVSREPIGLLTLSLSKKPILKMYQRLAIAFLLISGLALLIAYILSIYAQRTLSRPMSTLADFARSVGKSNDYSMRYQPQSGIQYAEEIQVLSDEFNTMLEQIELREHSIQRANEELEEKVTERTNELESLQRVAIENARYAGISEIATGVLHNIGNIVNSVGISAHVISEIIDHSKIDSLIQATDLLNKNKSSAAEFFSHPTKGQALIEYLNIVGSSLLGDNQKLKNEIQLILNKIDLMIGVVRSQQAYAKGQFMTETFQISALCHELINMISSMVTRENIKIIETYNNVPDVETDRVKISHVIINLLKNAKEALEGQTTSAKQIKIRTETTPEKKVSLSIEDNGAGIAPDHLDKIFSHGFTTKVKGHGFGLHFCANTMAELGGSLQVESEGVGKGSRFTIILPPKRDIS